MQILHVETKQAKKIDAMPSGADDWYFDRYESVLVQRDRAYLLTLLLIALLTIMVAATSYLYTHTRKEVITYLMTTNGDNVDFQVIRDEVDKSLSGKKVVLNHMIKNFIRAREGYSASSANNNLDMVRIYASNKVYHEYYEFLGRDNLAGFFRQYKDQIRSPYDIKITHLKEGQALVRFKAAITGRGESNVETVQGMIDFEIDANKKISKREFENFNFINFSVTAYSSDVTGSTVSTTH